MLEILILFLLPSCLTLILYRTLRKNGSKILKILIPFGIFALSLILQAIIIETGTHSATLSVSTWFITISLAVACAVLLALEIFQPDFTEKGKQIAAFLAPFISVPFILTMFIIPEMVAGTVYPDYYFSKRLPVSGQVMDLFTQNYEFVAGSDSFLPGVLLNIGFLIEMIIVMLFVFICLKIVSGFSRKISGTESRQSDE